VTSSIASSRYSTANHWADSMSPLAFCQARMKLKSPRADGTRPTIAEDFDHCFSPRLWPGCRWFVFEAPGQLLTSLILAMAACIEAVQPDRSFPRKIKPVQLRGFYPDYKRCRQPLT